MVFFVCFDNILGVLVEQNKESKYFKLGFVK